MLGNLQEWFSLDSAASDPDLLRQRLLPAQPEFLLSLEGSLERIAARHPGELIVLVAHGGVLDAIYRMATRQAPDATRTWQLPNAAINRLLWSPEGLAVVGWSDTGHLEVTARDESSA
jgi:probable phosphoglycerate mutase